MNKELCCVFVKNVPNAVDICKVVPLTFLLSQNRNRHIGHLYIIFNNTIELGLPFHELKHPTSRSYLQLYHCHQSKRGT